MYNFQDKETNLHLKNMYMLTRTLSMFDYEGLPDTIPEQELEKLLQVNGYAFITVVDNDLYAFVGSLGGESDVYGKPTEITVSNPHLKLSKTYNILNEGVLLVNDDLQMGLVELYNYYNTMLVENDITLFLENINNRMQTLISASDNGTIESAEQYLQDIIDGELGIIGENAMFESLKVNNNLKQSNNVTSLIEFHQYIKASLYNEVGLNANFNMKRERLTAGEVEMNNDNLYPLVDNMLHVRQEGVNELNDRFGLNVTVELGSVWNKINMLDENVPRETIESEVIDDDESETDV